MAQSSLEAVEKELLNIDSELNDYLYEQISSGLWVSIEEKDSSGNNPSLTGSISELEFDLNHNGVADIYRIKATFSYSINDDEEDDYQGTPDVDESGSAENMGENVGIADASSYTVYVKITAVRGNENDRDYQSYTVSDEYYTVLFN